MNRPSAADDEKKARLAAALRENLKRRKAQARARHVDEAASRQDEPSDVRAGASRS